MSCGRGLRYKSRRKGHTGETIVFDKEIAPGIFTPSAPVPDDLAEEYRNVFGTLGVMVNGSIKNEMTPAEVGALHPDGTKAVEQAMRSTAPKLPTGSELSWWEIQFRDATGKLPGSLGLNTRIAARDWLDQHPEAKQEWADQKAREFSVLVAMLEEHGREERAKIPEVLRERLARDLHPIAWEKWDSWSEEERYRQGVDWVAQHHPGLETNRQTGWDKYVVDWVYWQQVPSLTAQEFCILRHVHDPRKFEDDRNSIPSGEGKTLGERVSDDVRIIERSLGPDAKKSAQEWVSWAHQQGWGIPSYLRNLADEGDAIGADKDRDETSNTSHATIKGEKQCEVWLRTLMAAGSPSQPKHQYEVEAIQQFKISSRGFARVWQAAVAETGNVDWSSPGRKSRRRIDTPK